MRRWPSRPLTALLAIALISVAVLAALLTRIGPPGAAIDRSITTARNTGRQIAINISSYDYTKLPQQFAAVSSEITGESPTGRLSRSPKITVFASPYTTYPTRAGK